MSRGERSALVTAALLLFGLFALVNETKAENLFPNSADDGNLEEEARYGVISVRISSIFLRLTSKLE